MSEEKKYSARDAAIAVLKKAEEVLKKSESVKKIMSSDATHKTLTQGFPDKAPSAKMTAFMQGKKPKLAKGEDAPKEKVEGEPKNPGDRIESQPAPEKNPKEQAEGNNELAGTTPTQVGQDGKNLPGHAEVISGHFKLAKFIGRMHAKRKTPPGGM